MRVLSQRYASFSFDPDHTYLFEIVYQNNQIVVDYGGMDDLILLAVIQTATGQEVPLDRLTAYPFPRVRRYDGIHDFDQLAHLMAEREGDNEEGFVVRFAGGLRVKCKLESYKRLHKLLTGVNARTIWEFVSRGEDLDTLLAHVPDEFYRWVLDERNRLEAQFRSIEAACRAMCSQVADIPDRKLRAEMVLATGEHNPYVVFRMLDDKPYAEAIWKLLKPGGGESTFRRDDPA
jgi:RNA ligase